jgi:ribose 5-phosphate isomerase RpiB
MATIHKMHREYQSGPYVALCGPGNGNKMLAHKWKSVNCATCRKIYASTLKQKETAK